MFSLGAPEERIVGLSISCGFDPVKRRRCFGKLRRIRRTIQSLSWKYDFMYRSPTPKPDTAKAKSNTQTAFFNTLAV